MAEEEVLKKKSPWLRAALWVLLTPLALFVLLMVLLYVPPVQDFIRRQAVSVAEEATGMQLAVERIDLRFPLDLVVRGVRVVQPADSMATQHPDTLLTLGNLSVRVQAWPLLRGQVEVDGVSLEDVSVNSVGLLDGMRLEGTLGRFFLRSHGVDLNRESVILNEVTLEDTHLRMALADTTASPPDTTSTPIRWKVLLHALRLKNVSVDLQMPLDSMHLSARLGEARMDEAEADLGCQVYGWQKFLLTGTALAYDSGAQQDTAVIGFDPSHIAVRDVRIGIDSVRYDGRQMNAVIREFTLNERSGLSITSLTGRLTADSTLIQVPALQSDTGACLAIADTAQPDRPERTDLLGVGQHTYYRTSFCPVGCPYRQAGCAVAGRWFARQLQRSLSVPSAGDPRRYGGQLEADANQSFLRGLARRLFA